MSNGVCTYPKYRRIQDRKVEWKVGVAMDGREKTTMQCVIK